MTPDPHPARTGPAAADARAPGGPARTQHAIDEEAAGWAVRRHAGLDAAGQAQLQLWLAADPRHASALAQMSATLGAVRQLPPGAAARVRDGLQQPAAQGSRRAWRRVPWLGPATMALAALAIVGAGAMQWWRAPTFEQSYATTRGQQVVATLPDDAADGSTVQLDTATRIEATLYRDRREVRLREGQAMFVVHADHSRPFHVRAGDLRITVVGTRFSVRQASSGIDAGRTVVAVEAGRVRVARMPRGYEAQPQEDAAVELAAGEMVASDSDGPLGPVTAIAPQAVAPWRSGRISFDHTPLAQALAEFERYGSTGFVVRDPAVAALPVGGSYGLRQFQRFAQTLPEVLPVRLVKDGAVTEIVAR